MTADEEWNRDPAPASKREFEIHPLLTFGRKEFQHIILHYVNYGYHHRGIPFGLLSTLRELRRSCSGHLLTIFHELYASGPPWRSSFWLRPFQRHLAGSIAKLSDTSIVSSEAMLGLLNRLTTRANAKVHPVFSNFGEPALRPDQIANRSSHRWVICGGTIMVERALRSFREILDQVTPDIFPRELLIVGGSENPQIRALLNDLPAIRSEYYPRVSVSEASPLLASCSFAWIDYFHRANVPTDTILKSGAFAAACAHGLIPIFPHGGSSISLEDDRLPGPFFIDRSFNLPPADGRARIAASFYDWYQRNASSDHLVRGIAGALGLANNP